MPPSFPSTSRPAAAVAAACALALALACADEPVDTPTSAPAAAEDPAPAPDASDLAAGAWARRPLVGGSEGPAGTAAAPDSTWSRPLGGPVAEVLGSARVRSPHHAYGRVFEGTQVLAHFVVESVGDEPLVVVAVQSSCGCAQPELRRVIGDGELAAYERGTPLAPGEHLRVDVVFDTRRRSGRDDRPIFLYANVPGGRIELELRGEVVPLLHVEPAEITFGQVLAGTDAELPFEVTSADASPVSVAVDRDALPLGVEFEFVPVEPGPDGRAARWSGRAKLGRETSPSVVRWPVRLVSERTSTGPSGEVALGGSVLLAVDLVAPIELRPPHLSLGVVAAGTMRSEHAGLWLHDPGIDPRTLTVRVEGELAGEALGERVRARLVPRATGSGATGGGATDLELVLSDLPAGVAGRLSGRAIVETPEGRAQGMLGFTGVLTGR